MHFLYKSFAIAEFLNVETQLSQHKTFSVEVYTQIKFLHVFRCNLPSYLRCCKIQRIIPVLRNGHRSFVEQFYTLSSRQPVRVQPSATTEFQDGV